MRPRPVCILWQDAQASHGWSSDFDATEDDLRVVTIGTLLEVTKGRRGCYIVAAAVDKSGNGNAIMHIPKVCVIEYHEIESVLCRKIPALRKALAKI